MAKYLKPQTPLQHYNGDYIYPITSADQVLVSNGERLNANLINVDLNNSDNIPENVLKPQNPMVKGSDYFYPLTTSDQIIMPDGTRLDTENIGGMSMELLWENASPSSIFASQTININGKGCNIYLVKFLSNYILPDEVIQPLIINVGEKGSVVISNGSTDSVNGILYVGKRRILNSNDTSIVFDSGYVHPGSNFIASNDVCIPYQIYGIKGVN